MSQRTPYTYEGYTNKPIFPSTVVLNFNTGNLTEDATPNWKDQSGGDRALTIVADPFQTIDEVLNGAPYTERITVPTDGSTGYATLDAGVYRVSWTVLIEESAGGGIIEPGLAICDDDSESHVSSTTAFWEYDGDGEALIASGESACFRAACLVSFSQPSRLRFVAVDRDAGNGTATLRKSSAVITRISNYTVGV